MTRITTLAFTIGLALCLSNAAAYAQGKGKGVGRSPEVSHGKGHAGDHGPDQREAKETKEDRRGSDLTDRIERNPELKTKLADMLPPGTNLKAAASGFKNQGQFIAALHVSKNLNIPFNRLKARMTGSHPQSLGQAIQDLKPNMPAQDVKKAAEKAEKEAKATEKINRIS